MTDDKRPQDIEQIKNEEGERITAYNMDGLLTFAGQPLHFDPETGEPIIEEMTAEQREQLAASMDKIREAYKAFMEPQIKAASRVLNLAKLMQDTILTDEIREIMHQLTDSLLPIQELVEEIKALEPYLKAEMDKPEYEGKTLDYVLHNHTPRELLELLEDKDSYFYKAIYAARAAKNEQAPEALPRIRYTAGAELRTSTDKLANVFYSFAAPKSKASGQRSMLPIPREEMIPLKYEKNNAPPITLFYDFYFNEQQLRKLGIDNGFDSYDFFITAVMDNIKREGNDVVSLSKVWRELGNTGSPNTSQLTELYKRIARGASTIITIDDSEVQQAWGNIDGDGTYKEIVSPIMPVQLASEKFIANGNVAKAQIIINGLSPFYVLSQNIGHFTTWKKEILQLYSGRKTGRYYTVLQYLMSQIAWIRNPNSKRNNKITYRELYEYNGDKSTRAKQLTRDMAYRLLTEVFKPAGYVSSFKEDNKGEPGIVIRCSKNAAAALPNS